MRNIILIVVTVSLFGCSAASFHQTKGQNGTTITRAYVNSGASLKYDPVTGLLCLDARNVGGDGSCGGVSTDQ